MDPKKLRLQRPDFTKEVMNDLYSKFVVGLQKASQSAGASSSTGPTVTLPAPLSTTKPSTPPSATLPASLSTTKPSTPPSATLPASLSTTKPSTPPAPPPITKTSSTSIPTPPPPPPPTSSSPARRPPRAAGVLTSCEVTGSAPSTSSGFVNNPMAVNGVRGSGGEALAARNIAKSSRKCGLCSTDSLSRTDFVCHVLGKRHRIMEAKQKRTKLQKEERDRRTLHLSGFPEKAFAEEIGALFFELGMIDFHWMKRHAFVEFGSRDDAVAALRKPLVYQGVRLNTAPRTQRSHVDDARREESVETLLTPQIKRLIDAPCRSLYELLNVLQELLFSVQLRPDEYERRNHIRNYVARILRPYFSDVSCNIFGSSANNLGFTGADLDLFASLGYDPYDCPREADGAAEAARLVNQLATIFRKQREVSNVVPIPRARVPIVKFHLFGVSVDLSFRNAMPIQNTALIKMFTNVHPSVRPYMMFVRFWAKTQNVAGGGKPATLLTNYALTMLMAFVVMTRGKILPSVAQLREGVYETVIINGWNCGFSDVIPPAYRQTRNFPIFELALEFFDYYSDLDASQWVICPLLGRLISKQDITSKSKKRLRGLEDYCMVAQKIQIDTPLCVQDPFDLIHNITRGLTNISFERFQLLCRRSSVILRKVMDLQLPLRALFDPIELSDEAYSSEVDSVVRPLSSRDDRDPEIVELDEEKASSSQEVEILDEIVQRIPCEPEQITLDDDDTDSSQGIKRSLTDDSGVSDMSMATNISTNSVSSLDQKSFLSELDFNSPYLFKFQVPSVKLVEVNVNTGALSYKEGDHTAEDVRWSGLNILTFVLRHIFAAGVISRVAEGESPSKKLKGAHLDTVHCFGILLVTFKHNISENREIFSNEISSSDSPFAFEKSVTDRLLKKTSSQSHSFRYPFSVQFHVCYRGDKEHELLLVANESILSESNKEQLRSLLQDLRRTTEQCVHRALQRVSVKRAE